MNTAAHYPFYWKSFAKSNKLVPACLDPRKIHNEMELEKNSADDVVEINSNNQSTDDKSFTRSSNKILQFKVQNSTSVDKGNVTLEP